MLNKEGDGKPSPKFEVNFVVRDKTGKAIGGRKKFSSSRTYRYISISIFFQCKRPR